MDSTFVYCPITFHRIYQLTKFKIFYLSYGIIKRFLGIKKVFSFEIRPLVIHPYLPINYIYGDETSKSAFSKNRGKF